MIDKEKDKQSIRVEIFGQEYFIKSAGSVNVDYVKGVAAYVDKKMREIEKKVKEESTDPSMMSTYKMAILTALNIGDELFQARKKEQEDHEIYQKETEKKIDDIISVIDSSIENQK